METFASTPTDVLSLEEAKIRIESDNSLTQNDKSYAKEVIDHITESSRLTANDQRKAISIGEFLGN